MTQFVDSHCHIDGPDYDADREDVIARAVDAGVTTMLNVGTGVPSVDHAQDARATPDAGVLHCFGGTLEMARQAIELGFYISFAGTLTFKKADDLREIARQLPLERLLVETDCPYLTPVPFRGKRNEPARVVETAKCLAGIHERSSDEIGRITTENFARLFGVSS